MKVLFILVTIISCFCMACHEQTVGFLVTENASYDPDSLVIRKIPDPEEDRVSIMLHGFLLIYKDTREPPKFNLTWNPCHLL